ncbi:uncharacterized protein kuk [Bactrocera oleae]|uniref:uncharacterized protein kuk n=1 Tax=Bactrocera oleae TaxID=104688 RepID=UPI00387E921D
MSTKATTQHTRRAPLSLSGGGKQQSQNHYSGKSADSNGNSSNSASAKNDNKHSASQKTEASVNDVKDATPKDLKKPQNADKKQQQQSANNETVKKNEKTDEKKTQNGSGKVSTNGGAKEKQQNGSDKQDNNSNSNGSNAKMSSTNSNGNSNAKVNTKSNEKAATPAAKEDVKTKEPKLAEPAEKSEKESEKEKEKEKEKKKESEQEKETRSRRHEATVAAELEKKQTDKNEPKKGDDSKMEVATPTSRSSAGQAKSRATPTTGVEKSGRSTPTKPMEKSTASPRNKIITTVIDDVEMEPLTVESSPAKSKENTSSVAVAAAARVLQPPAATSTPGKAPATQKTKTQTVDAKSDHPINVPSCGSSPDRKSVPRTITHIGGRRSIRPLNEYTPSKFQSNLQFRESYRRINTELDVSSTTNSSMNVTVGSEIPNNSSFSFFGRGRKRDRTPPRQSQSTMELQTDADYSPPKRARLDMYTLFSVVSSPLTMLRSRFSRASIQSSTPVKLTTKLAATDEDEADVQNVSGISIEEETATDGAESDEKTATEDVTVEKNTDDDTTPKIDSPMKVDEKCGMMEKGDKVSDEMEEDAAKFSNVHEVAAGIADTSVSSVKNKRCNIM